jgi:chromosome segregation protein
MRIKKIELEGFRGFRDPVEIPIPAGFLVIQGPNGAGKSSICDAIDFCLTGEINRFVVDKGGREQPTDYYWWRGKGKAANHFVRLTFVDDSGVESVISRTRDGCDHSPEALENLLCGDNLPEDPLRTLVDISIIRDESISALSLDLQDTDRYRRVQRALGALAGSDFSARIAAVKGEVETLNKNNERSEQEHRSELTTLLARISERRSQAQGSEAIDAAARQILTVYPDAPSELPEMAEFARRKASESQSAIRVRAAAFDRFRQLAPQLADAESQEFKDRLAAARAKVASVAKDIEEKSLQLEQARSLHSAELAADAFAAAYRALLDHGEEIGLQADHCPLCNSAVSNDQFRDAIAAARERLNERGAKAGEAEERVRALQEEFYALNRRLQEGETEVSVHEIREAEIGRMRAEIDQAVSEAGIVVFGTVEITGEDFEQAIRRVREEFVGLEGPLRVLESSQIVTELAELERGADTIRRQLALASLNSSLTSRALASLKAAEHTVSRTAGELLDEHLAAIAPLLSELFLRLKPHSDWRSIDYKVRGDVRRFLSLAVGEDLNPQFVFSTGQKRITGLAFLLSIYIARYWCRWHTLILDDPIQHIDDYRALNLVEVLSAIRRDKRQVICGVEDSALADLLCRRLRATEGEEGAIIQLGLESEGRASVQNRRDLPGSRYRVLDAFQSVAAA